MPHTHLLDGELLSEDVRVQDGHYHTMSDGMPVTISEDISGHTHTAPSGAISEEQLTQQQINELMYPEEAVREFSDEQVEVAGLFGHDPREVYLALADVEKIKVKHEGVLEIPKGKSFSTVGLKHYINLAKKKGKPAVMRGLLNLERWNKNKNPKLSEKARSIINRLKENSEWKKI